MEHKAYLAAADMAELVVGKRGDVLSVEKIPSGGGDVETAEYVHQCRFAAAAGSADGDVFSVVYVKGYAVQRPYSAAAHTEVAAEFFNFDRHGDHSFSWVVCTVLCGLFYDVVNF